MGRKISFLTVTALLIFSYATAADLYLIEITSHDDLISARNIVDYAHGTIDGRFLVDLDRNQASEMTKAGIDIEPAGKDMILNATYLVSHLNVKKARSAVLTASVYSKRNVDLIELVDSEITQLRREGYTVIPLAEIKTPLFYQPTMISLDMAQEFPSDTIANLISAGYLYNYDTRLEAFVTRYYSSDSIISARDWIVAKFQSFGYDSVYYDDFYYGDKLCHNVICVKPGTVYPDALIVIGAHYDSINFDSPAEEYAPGADDNGSGTAGVLELARVFKDIDTERSIMFVAFSAEEIGLVGSRALADRLYEENAQIEFMHNMDMIGYQEDAEPDVTLYSGPFRGYADVVADALTRVTDLIPVYQGSAGNSDHASFANNGYHVAFTIEGDFNYDGWHTNLDISSRLDFNYMASVVKGVAAAVEVVDKSARPTLITDIYDAGDGQSLRVNWEECHMDYLYQVLYGVQSGIYIDTADVPAGNCTYDVTGLTEGQTYYFAVKGINGAGNGPVYLTEESAVPLSVPHLVQNFKAEPDSAKIQLSWSENKELDLSHYRLLRRTGENDWLVHEDNLTDTVYVDLLVEPLKYYEYAVVAVDNDLNESEISSVAGATPATFNAGILLADETEPGYPFPPADGLDEMYDDIFENVNYSRYRISSKTDTVALTRSVAGQFSSIFYVDDDGTKMFNNSIDSIRWYLDFNTNFLIAGHQTLYWTAGGNPLGPGDFAFDYFGITLMEESNDFAFAGAFGQNGWPDVEVVPSDLFGNYLSQIGVFDNIPEAEVIYTYNSAHEDPRYHNRPVGLAFESSRGKYIALGFPLYYLAPEGRKALISRALEYFGETAGLFGDVDGNGRRNILDIVYMINFLYKDGAPPPDMNRADVNGDCEVNLVDVIYFINFKFKNGLPLLSGCAE